MEKIKAIKNSYHTLLLILSIMMSTLFLHQSAAAQDNKLVVRIARLQIDSAQLESYKALLKEGAETAVRVEPGVLTLYAVYEKEHPTHVTVFEVYANEAAYKAHIQTAHFLKYKNGTKDMVKSLELIDVTPIALGSKTTGIK